MADQKDKKGNTTGGTQSDKLGGTQDTNLGQAQGRNTVRQPGNDRDSGEAGGRNITGKADGTAPLSGTQGGFAVSPDMSSEETSRSERGTAPTQGGYANANEENAWEKSATDELPSTSSEEDENSDRSSDRNA